MASDLIRKSKAVELFNFYTNHYDGISLAISALENMEAVDAVEVVRCKDCIYGEQDPILDIVIKCGLQGVGMLQNSYCSWGEKKWTEEKNELTDSKPDV